MSDGTLEMTNSMNQASYNVSAKWGMNADAIPPTITFSDSTNGTFTFELGEKATFTWNGTLGSLGDMSVTFEMETSELAGLM